jgi:AcrR family transcriptional regulator
MAQQFRRKREAARSEIVAAAESALHEVDFNELTVDLVMRGTGMRRSSFYHYFSGLEELALALLDEFEDDMQSSLEPLLSGDDGDDPRGAMRDGLTSMFEVMHENRVGVAAVGEAAGGSPRVYLEWRARVLDYFVDRSAELIRRHVMRGNSNVENPERLAEALVLMNYAVFNANIHREPPDEPQEVARLAASVWNAAIFG